MQGRKIEQQTDNNLEHSTIYEAASGSKKAMAVIVKAYEKKVYGLAFKFTGNHQDAEEVLQETFIKVFKGISGFKGRSSFSTWLYRIAANQAIDMVGKKKLPTVVIEDNGINEPVVYDWTAKPENVSLSNEMNQVLKGSIDELPYKLKIAFILKDIEQLTYQETAAVLDERHINTVRTRVHRARLMLRNKLTGYLMEK